MKTILQNSDIKTWCYRGLAGLTIMAGVFLEDGLARTYSPFPANSLAQVMPLNPLTNLPSSKTIKKTESPTNISKQIAIIPSNNNHLIAKEPAKKRMGLAIIFLGALAKER